MKMLIEKSEAPLRKIISAGFCEFTPAEGQEVIILKSDIIPGKLYNVETGQLVDDPELALIEERNKSVLELDEIDKKSIRALRAILLALAEGKKPDQGDLDKLKEHEAGAVEARQKMK